MPSFTRYIIAFAITAGIFATAFYISDTIQKQRIAQIESIQEKISIDILSLETQFDLFQQLSCTDISENTVLTGELNSLARRLSFAESQLGTDNTEVEQLKRQYSLLQIKDYLLMKKIAEKCKNLKPVFILFFYSNAGDCEECERMGDVLTYFRETYPTLRVYSFDYNLDLSALKTLITINKIEPELPAIIVNDKAYYGFHNREDIEKIIPELKKLEKQEENGTSTTPQ